MGITHATTAVGTDAGTGEIHKAEWNAEHLITGLGLAFIGCSISGSSTALSSAAYTSLAFGSADTFDSDGFHDPSSNNTRMTIPAGMSGQYLLCAQSTWPSSGSANADRRLSYRINGAAEPTGHYSERYSVTSLTSVGNFAVVLNLVAGDYVEVRQWTGIGSTTTTVYTAQLVKLDSGKVGQGIGARASASAVTSIADQTWTSIAYADTDRFDTDGFHNPASNNTRLTVPAGLGGLYVIGGTVGIAFHATGNRAARIFLNNATRIGGEVFVTAAATAGATRMNVTTVHQLVPGDYVELQGWQNSGGALNSEDTEQLNDFWIARLDSGSSPTPPGYEFDYVQITSPVNVTATSEATATTIITGNPIAYDGSTIVMLEFFFSYVSAPLSAARDWEIIFYDSVAGSSMGGILHGTISSGSNQRTTAYGLYRITPSAATHTYSVRGFLGAAGTLVAGAGAGGNGTVLPSFLRITKV